MFFRCWGGGAKKYFLKWGKKGANHQFTCGICETHKAHLAETGGTGELDRGEHHQDDPGGGEVISLTTHADWLGASRGLIQFLHRFITDMNKNK